MNMRSSLPFKSTAIALLFAVLLGPLGLLYASLWGGILMLAISLIVLTSKFLKLILLIWVICSIWAVSAVEIHNKQLFSLMTNNN